MAGDISLTREEVLRRYSEGPNTGIFTDGGARPNPGPGGWGVVRVDQGKIVKELHGFAPETTNNRMELTALIEAYKIIQPEESIEIYSDSELCVRTINEWAKAWEKNNWKRKSGPIANLELVKELYELARSKPKASLRWIKAHNGWLWNEYADSLSSEWTRKESFT